MKNPKNKQLCVELSLDQYAELERRALAERRTKKAIVVAALFPSPASGDPA